MSEDKNSKRKYILKASLAVSTYMLVVFLNVYAVNTRNAAQPINERKLWLQGSIEEKERKEKEIRELREKSPAYQNFPQAEE